MSQAPIPRGLYRRRSLQMVAGNGCYEQPPHRLSSGVLRRESERRKSNRTRVLSQGSAPRPISPPGRIRGIGLLPGLSPLSADGASRRTDPNTQRGTSTIAKKYVENWAGRHPGAVTAVAYMEAIVCPVTWDDQPDATKDILWEFRSPAGEELSLERNLFVDSATYAAARPTRLRSPSLGSTSFRRTPAIRSALRSLHGWVRRPMREETGDENTGHGL